MKDNRLHTDTFRKAPKPQSFARKDSHQNTSSTTQNIFGEGKACAPSNQSAGAEVALSGTAVSRRGFIGAAAGLVGAAVATSALAGCSTTSAASDTASDADSSSSSKTAVQDSDLTALSVASNQVFTTEDCTFTEDADACMTLAAQVTLPFGSTVTSSDSDVACVMLPGDTGDPLVQVAIMSLGNGTYTVVLPKAQNPSKAYQIYDARANSNGVVWLEADILSDTWCIYTARLTNNGLGDIQMVAQEGSDWDMPTLAIAGNYAFWQMLPSKDGNTPTADSVLMRAKLGEDIDDAQGVYFSEGRFACAPATSGDSIIITPRMNVSSTQYKLVCLDAASVEATETLALPTSMKPSCIGYGETGFSFGFDAIYESGGGIANLGTYTPAVKSADSSNYTDANCTWFRFPRTPVCAPAWCGKYFIVKSSTVVAGIDVTSKTYFTIESEGNGESYGEYLASFGQVDRVVTFANLNYTPISGDAIKECDVRIWSTRG
jgi:hypothetical protein